MNLSRCLEEGNGEKEKTKGAGMEVRHIVGREVASRPNWEDESAKCQLADRRRKMKLHFLPEEQRPCQSL